MQADNISVTLSAAATVNVAEFSSELCGLTSFTCVPQSGTSQLLDPLRDVVRSGKVPAQVLLDRYNGVWDGDLSRVYGELSF